MESIDIVPIPARAILITLLATLMAACGGGSSSPAPAPAPIPPPPDPTPDTALTGSVGDGPVSGATVRIDSAMGRQLATTISDATARYALEFATEDEDFPLSVTATGGVDMVTGGAPEFELRTVAHVAGLDQIANLNPFSTLIVRAASMTPGGPTADNVADATASVFAQAGFGLNATRFADPIGTAVSASNIAYMVKASESLGETVRRTHATVLGARPGLSADGVLNAIAADLVDGTLDGVGAGGTDLLVTATWKVSAGQVLIETLTNELRVNGVPAMALMDGAIQLIVADPDVMLTGQVTADAASLAQILAALNAAGIIMSGSALDQLLLLMEQIEPGMTPEQIATLVPDTAVAFFDAVLLLVPAADEDQLARIAGDGGTDNSPPVINGTPATAVNQDEPYSFVPEASDPDDDALTFSIANPPAWTSFDSVTGALAGTPGNDDVGLTGMIVISVSDGQASAALPAFSLRVENRNDPPVIGGTPATTVNQDEPYSFVPVASDPDDDALTFSIANPPAWASFDSVTGVLAGTPGNDDVGQTDMIVISVSDGQASAALPAFSLRVENRNDPPVIGGTPAITVNQDESYSFVPQASDPDNDPLNFSIANPPSWAMFDPQSGTLAGTPDATDVGVTTGIVISVSDGSVSTALPPFDIAVLAAPTGNAVLTWTPPTENADLTPLTDLAGYRIYYSTTLGNYVDFVDLPDPGLTSAVLEELAAVTWFFAITAYDVSGNESEFSDFATKTVN